MHAHMCLACSKWQGSQCDQGRVSEVMRAERRQRARPQKACRLCTYKGFVFFAPGYDGELLVGFEYNSSMIALYLISTTVLRETAGGEGRINKVS